MTLSKTLPESRIAERDHPRIIPIYQMTRSLRQRPMHSGRGCTTASADTCDIRYPSDPRKTTALLHIRPAGAVDAVDHDLEAFLQSAWRKLHTLNRRPPRCPRCRTSGANCDGNDSSGLPQFFCPHCHRRFNRLTGTPMARLKAPAKLWTYFGLISRPMQVAECARQLDIRHETVLNWSLQTRLWLLALDPTGSWERRVQLGVRYAVAPASALDRPAPAMQGCKCVLIRGEEASLPEENRAPLLMRVCPLCERAGRPRSKTIAKSDSE